MCVDGTYYPGRRIRALRLGRPRPVDRQDPRETNAQITTKPDHPARLGLFIIVSFVTLWLSRWPLITGLVSAPDVDESVTGLLAMDILAGRWPGVFFPGQPFGLSLLEAVTVALGFSVRGELDATSLRHASAALWSMSGVIMALGVYHLRGLLLAAAFVGLFTLCPAWFEFSIKARSGYLSALIFVAWSFLAAASRQARPVPGDARGAWWLVFAFSVTMTALSQALFVACLLPELAVVPWREWRRYLGWSGLGVALASMALLDWIGAGSVRTLGAQSGRSWPVGVFALGPRVLTGLGGISRLANGRHPAPPRW